MQTEFNILGLGVQASELFADGHHGGFHHFSDKEEDGDERAGWLFDCLLPSDARARCLLWSAEAPTKGSAAALTLYTTDPLSSAA